MIIEFHMGSYPTLSSFFECISAARGMTKHGASSFLIVYIAILFHIVS